MDDVNLMTTLFQQFKIFAFPITLATITAICISTEIVKNDSLYAGDMAANMSISEKPAISFFQESASSAVSVEAFNKTAELENCLKNCYNIDDRSFYKIALKLRRLIENSNYHSVVDDFIEKSNDLKVQFIENKICSNPSKDDAVIIASKWHEVLFESPYVRVLWLNSFPGEFEPFHKHQWKSIMVIINEGKFEIINSDGSLEQDLWPIGVYELPAETHSSSYKNIGESEFQALRFEIKD